MQTLILSEMGYRYCVAFLICPSTKNLVTKHCVSVVQGVLVSPSWPNHHGETCQGRSFGRNNSASAS
jgi:hypothetical protein